MDANDHTHSQSSTSGQPTEQDFSKPVAYDQQGRPLYAHPSQNQNNGAPQMVYMSRPLNPAAVEIPEAVQKKEAETRKKYPHLNISKGEYVIAAVRRHPIGVIQIWIVVLLVIGIFAALFMLFLNAEASPLVSYFGGYEEAKASTTAIVGFLTFLSLMGGLAATYIYENNRFYLTNESVIQEIQTSLFSKHEQTVSLSNIEDASFLQNNPIQMILNYGSIRLSTEGDETTYRFSYVAHPKKHIAMLNNAVEAFKNGRPIDDDD